MGSNDPWGPMIHYVLRLSYRLYWASLRIVVVYERTRPFRVSFEEAFVQTGGVIERGTLGKKKTKKYKKFL